MQKIDKILVGTHNKGKFKEISDLLPKKIKKISPLELGIESPIESGKTFEKNSQIKASFFCEKSRLVTLSDDSGLQVDCLNGDPGLKDNKDLDKFLNNIKIVEEDLISIFKKNKIEKIDTKNKKFDPNFHQAMTEIEDDSVQPGIIVQEMLAGYMFGDRLLRPSLVAVSKKKAQNEVKKPEKEEKK